MVENMSHFIKWSKICPILLLGENMSTLFSGRKNIRRKHVHRKNVPVPQIRSTSHDKIHFC